MAVAGRGVKKQETLAHGRDTVLDRPQPQVPALTPSSGLRVVLTTPAGYEAVYGYTYDDGDNMTQKVEPSRLQSPHGLRRHESEVVPSQHGERRKYRKILRQTLAFLLVVCATTLSLTGTAAHAEVSQSRQGIAKVADVKLEFKLKGEVRQKSNDEPLANVFLCENKEHPEMSAFGITHQDGKFETTAYSEHMYLEESDVESFEVTLFFYKRGYEIEEISLLVDRKQDVVDLGIIEMKESQTIEAECDVSSVDFGESLPSISSFSLSADGKHAISGSGNVRYWDLASAECLAVLRCRSRLALALALTEDCESVVIGYLDGYLRLWNIKNAAVTMDVFAHYKGVNAVDISKDKKSVLTCGADGKAILWSTSSRCPIWTFTLVEYGQAIPINDIAFLPGSERFVTGSSDGSVRLHDLNTGEELHKYAKHPASVTLVQAASSGGGVISVTGQPDNTIRVLRDGVASPVVELQADQRITSMTILDDGKRLIAGAENGVLYDWHLGGSELRRIPTGKGSAVTGLSGSQEAGRLGVAFADGVIEIYSLEKLAEVPPLIALRIQERAS